jgi:hypothetical protein
MDGGEPPVTEHAATGVTQPEPATGGAMIRDLWYWLDAVSCLCASFRRGAVPKVRANGRPADLACRQPLAITVSVDGTGLGHPPSVTVPDWAARRHRHSKRRAEPSIRRASGPRRAERGRGQ